MHCKLCNTRISPGERTCPNCGADVRGMSGSHPGPAPRKFRPAVLPQPGATDGREAELPLEDIAGQTQPGIATGAGASGSGRRSAAPAPAPSGPTAMGPASLRSLLADQPELLEPGLRVYRDESGAAAGVHFATGVGAAVRAGLLAGRDPRVAELAVHGQGPAFPRPSAGSARP